MNIRELGCLIACGVYKKVKGITKFQYVCQKNGPKFVFIVSTIFPL